MQPPGSCLVGVTSKAEEVLLRSLPPPANVASAVPHHQALALSAAPSAPASALAPSAHNGLQVAQGVPALIPPPPVGLPAQYLLPLPPAEVAAADERGASPPGRGGRGGRGRGRRGRPPGPGRGCIGRGRARVDTTERQGASCASLFTRQRVCLTPLCSCCRAAHPRCGGSAEAQACRVRRGGGGRGGRRRRHRLGAVHRPGGWPWAARAWARARARAQGEPTRSLTRL